MTAEALAAFHVAFQRDEDVFRRDAACQGFVDDEAHHDLGPQASTAVLARVKADVVEHHRDDAHAAVPGLIAAVHGDLHVDAGFLPGLVLARVHQVFGSAGAVQQGHLAVLRSRWRMME